jgi:hypothetical protein
MIRKCVLPDTATVISGFLKQAPFAVLSVLLRYTDSGYNDNIKGVGNLSSPGYNEINVMSLFNNIPRTKRSHGYKRIQQNNDLQNIHIKLKIE